MVGECSRLRGRTTHGPARVAGTKHEIRHPATHNTQLRVEEVYTPAFFSCMVKSFQSTFMRSRSDIHKSACS